jgi:hypothetical protein
MVGRLAVLGTRAQRFSPATNPDWSYGEGLKERSHAITVSHRSAAILRIVNPILRFLLQTPVMGAARKQPMVVSELQRTKDRAAVHNSVERPPACTGLQTDEEGHSTGMLIRRVTRPLLSAAFIGQGIDALRSPHRAAETARPTVCTAPG